MALALSCVEKTCRFCGETKPDEGFHGRRCPECTKVANRAYYRANRDKIIERSKRYYEGHREEKKAYAREYRKTYYTGEVRKRLLAKSRERYHANPDQQAERSRRYYERNKIRFLEYAHRRRDLIGDAVVDVALLDAISREPCLYCGATERIEIDHIVPISRGGRHEPGNLAPACLPCNRSKHNRLLSEWQGRAAA